MFCFVLSLTVTWHFHRVHIRLIRVWGPRGPRGRRGLLYRGLIARTDTEFLGDYSAWCSVACVWRYEGEQFRPPDRFLYCRTFRNVLEVNGALLLNTATGLTLPWMCAGAKPTHRHCLIKNMLTDVNSVNKQTITQCKYETVNLNPKQH